VSDAATSPADRAEELVEHWLTMPEVAEMLSLDVTRARQLLRDHQLVALRVGGALRVPAALLQDGRVVKGLSGALTLLTDAHYSDDEAIAWLFTPDDTLPGTPVQALRENRGTEVKRRAQALGF
jgi:Rv2175c C-terminal domain of unknown function/Helix-turn-helix domain